MSAGAVNERRYAIRVENVAKSFGAVTALVDVSLRLGKGEVLGLDRRQRRRQVDADQDPDRLPCAPTAGRIFVDGDEVTLRSVDHARSLGIDTVYQDLALVPALSVAHNMFLKRELTTRLGPFRWLDNREMRKRAREYIDGHRDQHAALGRRRGRDALRRAAAGDRDRALGALRRADPPARRAARRDGRARGRA